MVGVVLNKKDINTSVGEALKLISHRLKMIKIADEFFPELVEKITTDLTVKPDHEMQELKSQTNERFLSNCG